MKTRYWSFWKVVFAGWLIRYPKVFFNALCWVVIVCAFLGLYSYDKVTDVLTESGNTERSGRETVPTRLLTPSK